MSLALTVSEFNHVFSDIVHHQLKLNDLSISGEITQFNYYNNRQHLYLTLGHQGAYLQCVIYHQHRKNVPEIRTGDQCTIIGECQFLKNKGQLMFSGASLSLMGVGHKKVEFDARIKDFENRGKFQKKLGHHLPRMIEKVCIITANQSAAHHDIMSILSKSDHTFESILVPSSVQGRYASTELQQALTIAETLSPDVICLSRGGGADHEFDCFYDPALANQIVDSDIPILAGIGHEINTTLVCLCSNKHFETPTAMIQWLVNHSIAPLHEMTIELTAIKQALLVDLDDVKKHLRQLAQCASQAFASNDAMLAKTIEQLREQIILLNPISKLNNGFVYCENQCKKPLITIHQIAKGDTIYISLTNGKASATVNHVSKTENS